MIKTKLILLFFLFTCRFSLDATIIETTILKNHENGRQFALYATRYGLKNFSTIWDNILHSKEPLLLLADQFAFVENSLFRRTSDIVRSLSSLNSHNFLPAHVTYNAIDYRLHNFCIECGFRGQVFSNKLKEIENVWWWWFRMPQSRIEKASYGFWKEMDLKFAMERDSLDSDFQFAYSKLKIGFFKEIPYKDLKIMPSIRTLLLILKTEIQRLSKFVIYTDKKYLIWNAINDLEKEYYLLQAYCERKFDSDELSMPLSKYIISILQEQNKKKLKVLDRIYKRYHSDFFSSNIIILEVLCRIYATDHSKVALFMDGRYGENLVQWFQKLGWSIIHKTTLNYDGVPCSDFDFFK